MAELMLHHDDKPIGQAHFAAPEGGGPAVLVLHAWWGLIPFFKRLCDRLAGEGFVALAPDLYWGTTANTIDEAKALMEQRDFPRMQEAAVAAVRALRNHPLNISSQIGVIGFFMGAAWATYLASKLTLEDIRAGVLFYGVGEGGDFSKCKADFIGHFAENDEWEPDEGVGHWFFEDDKPAYYNADAAKLAWERTLAFLRERLA